MILCQEDKEDLKWACQAALLEHAPEMQDFILNEATYEQLLNLVCNPYPTQEVYFEASDLELYAGEFLAECEVDIDGEQLFLYENRAQKTTNKKPSRVKKWAKRGAIGAGIGAAAIGTGAAADMYSTYKRARGGKGMGRALTVPVDAALGTAKGVGKGALAVGKGVGKGALAVGVGGAGLAKKAAGSAFGKGAIAGTLAATAYLIYRKMRKSGKSQSQAASAAAQAANRKGDKEDAQKWQAKARKAKAQGK
jgi:hypothetical protein